jgi:hypothetical protein
MPLPGKRRRVALEGIYVSKEHIVSIIRVKGISELLRSVLQLLITANVVPTSPILSIYLVFLRSVLQLLVTANDVPSSQILST